MKFSTIITPAALAAAATAMPTARSTGAFSVIALRSASPIHLQAVNAAGEKFYVGGSTASYCPSNVNPCPSGTETVFAGPNALDVEVPGGQEVYVDPTGALSFTQAHSAAIPAGSVQGSLSNAPGSPLGSLTSNAYGATGFMACPDNAANPTKWQVFVAIQNATVPTGNVADCLGFDAGTSDYNGDVPAWQYI